MLLPLDDYIAQDQEAIDDYFADTDPNLREFSLKYGSPDGQTYFIPGGYNTVVMYCNTEVFEAAGVELADDWTWDEFFEAGVAIKEANGGFLHPMGSGFMFVNVMPWLLTNGASTIDEEWTTATYNTPEAVAAAEFVKRCIDEELSPVPGGEFDARRPVHRRQPRVVRRRAVGDRRHPPTSSSSTRSASSTGRRTPTTARRWAGTAGRS